jgi:hypothetical protein
MENKTTLENFSSTGMFTGREAYLEKNPEVI